MKKFIALCLVLAMAATLFVGCAAKKATLEGTPAELIEKIYAQKSVEFAPVTLTPDDPDYGAMWDWFYYTGLADGSKVKEAAVSEPMIGSIAFVGYVFVLEDGIDAASFVQTLLDNADPRWNICVEAEETVADYVGSTVFFLMCP